MEAVENITQVQAHEPEPSSKVLPLGSAKPGRKRKSERAMSNEEQDLATHVSLCHLRYQQLEARLDGMETRLAKVENQLADLKATTQQSFTEIKLLLERQNSTKQTQMIATFGTIITAILAFIGYLITHHS